jgi:hypothetical protein
MKESVDRRCDASIIFWSMSFSDLSYKEKVVTNETEEEMTPGRIEPEHVCRAMELT